MKVLPGSLKRRSIVTRLIVYIVLFSSAVTLVTTSLQLYREYQLDLNRVTGAVENLRLSQLEGLVNSLWAIDEEHIDLTIQGIARIPDIRRVELADANGIAYVAGQTDDGATTVHLFPLVHREGDREFRLGELRVIVDLQGIYDRLLDRVWVVLLSNATRTFAVSAFIFLIFQHLVTRHLTQIANHAQNLSPQNLGQPLELDRSQPEGSPDEIGQLAMSLNAMCEKLRKSYADLSESEARFRHLAEHIDAVFWIGSPDWQNVLYVSPAYERVWGRPCADLYRSPQAWMQPIHPEDRPQVERTIAEAATALANSAADNSTHVDFPLYRVIHPDGTLRWISARAFPVTDESHALRYVVGIAADVTKQIDADKALRTAKEQAEQAADAKSQFLAHMSHELRTPLNAILGFSEVLEREIFGPLEPKTYREYAQDIRESGRHLLSIIDDILDLSRIEAGKVKLDIEQLEPSQLVEEAFKMVDAQAGGKPVSIENQLPAKLPTIGADRRAVVQVLINVISNAVKFTPAGGKVRIAAEHRPDGGINLRVTDNGCGIPPEEMADLFQPFARSNALLASGEEGTGLGLTICKQLMQLQGFDISIDSEVGRGTDVTLEFPGDAAQRLTGERPATRQAAG